MDVDDKPKNCQKCMGDFDPSAGPHYCYIQPTWFLQKQKNAGQVRYVFYDIESTQDKQMEIGGIPVNKNFWDKNKKYYSSTISTLQNY